MMIDATVAPKVGFISPFGATACNINHINARPELRLEAVSSRPWFGLGKPCDPASGPMPLGARHTGGHLLSPHGPCCPWRSRQAGLMGHPQPTRSQAGLGGTRPPINIKAH